MTMNHLYSFKNKYKSIIGIFYENCKNLSLNSIDLNEQSKQHWNGFISEAQLKVEKSYYTIQF